MNDRLKSLVTRISQLPLVKNILQWSKRSSFPGFKGVPIYNVVKFFLREIQRESLTIRSNSIAYSFFVALFPFIIFLITLVSFLQFRSVTEYLNTLHDSIGPVLPDSVDTFIFNDLINGIFTSQRGDLLSVGFVLALYFASNGVMSLMMGFEKNYGDAYTSRNIFRKRLLALGLTVVLGLMLFVGLSLILVSENLLGRMLESVNLSGWTVDSILIFRWIVILVLFYSVIAIIYRYGPNLKSKSAYFSPGANIATVGIILTSIGFAYYLNRFGNYNAIYGSLGAIIITLLWIKINALVILIGYELNASIAVNKNLLD